MSEFELPYPLRGIDENWAFSKQRKLTTREAVNMRSADPVDGRIKGSQRSGMTTYNTSAISTSTVKDINVLAYDSSLTSYSTSGSGTEWLVTLEEPGTIHDIKVSKFGDIFIIANDNQLLKYSASGVLQEKLVVTFGTTPSTVSIDPKFRILEINDLGGIWVGSTGGTRLLAGTNEFYDCLYYFVDGVNGLELRWSALGGDDSAGARQGYECRYMQYKDGLLYLAIRGISTASPDSDHDQYIVGFSNPTGATGPADIDDSVVLLQTSDNSTSTAFVMNEGTANTIYHVCGFDINELGEMAITGHRDITSGTLYAESRLQVLSPSGIPDSVTKKTSTVTARNGGFGSWVKWVTKDVLWTYGPAHDTADVTDRAVFRQYKYTKGSPNTFTETQTTGTVDILSNQVENGEADYLRPNYDNSTYDNLYAPRTNQDASPSTYPHRTIATSSSTSTFTNSPTSGPNYITAVGFQPEDPDYNDASIKKPQYLYAVGGITTVGGDVDFSLVNTRLVTATGSTGSPRSFKFLAAAGGDIKTFTTSATSTVGSGVLSATAQYVMSAGLYGEMFYTDGINYAVYNPSDDAAVEWTATTDGKIPENCKLITTWRGRIVLARDDQNPHNWHMSRVGDPFDWNQHPPVTTSTQAISGNNSEIAGLVPDVVNGLIPYNDDLLIFLCDHSIYRMTGDPMMGGFIDLVTDSVGGAFGRAWAKDPQGNVYFFGSQGGVFAMRPAGIPKRLSRDRIEERLRDLNLASYFIRLVWDFVEEGLRVFVLPFGAGGTLVQHWFWHQKTDSWWEDEYGKAGSLGTQPTAVTILDGDASSDRIILMAGEDGKLRYFDSASDNDDGTAIDARVVLGPLVSNDRNKQMRFTKMTAVLAQEGGCDWQAFVSETPETLPSTPSKSGKLFAGRNNSVKVQSRGTAFWVRLRNANAAERMGVENIILTAYPAGRARVTS